MLDAFARLVLQWALLLLLGLCTPAEAGKTAFPLQISANQRHLEDADGRPFLIVADTAWSLIGDLSREEADHYLEDRRKRGFNTILVSLIEHRFSRNAPGNFYRRKPFAAGGFAAPNDAYFDDAEWILRRAQDRGFLVLLVPAYLGVNGGDQGWYGEMRNGGVAAMNAYGTYIGKRFSKFNNIIWVQGGDYDPPDMNLVDALAGSIARANPSALQTVHGGRDARTDLVWQASWKRLDTLYTYGNVAQAALVQYRVSPARPFFLIEGLYEGENGATEETVRATAYSALLSGAGGQVFGNNPVWHFSGPGVHEETGTWQKALASRGAQSMTYLMQFFETIPWWELEPDQGKLLTPQRQPASSIAVGARSPGERVVVVYLSGTDSVALQVKADWPSTRDIRWFDPSSGQYMAATEPTAGVAGALEYHVPAARNASGYRDWLLIAKQRD